jgi:ABC-2 type transport system permease protein
MTRWSKVSTVATFEFLAAVKRPGYLIATFGMPLFMAAYGAVVAVPAYYAERKGREPSVYGLVDDAGLLKLSGDVTAPGGPQIPEEMRRSLEAAGQGQALDRALAISNFVFRPYVSDGEARRALAERKIKGYFVVPANYLAEGGVDAYSPDSFSFSGGSARDGLGDLLRERLVSERVEPGTSARILKPISRTRRFAVTRTGEVRDGGQAASAVRLAVPLVFMILFLLSILMTSGYLMQGTATEKENKVVEVLLASADPDEILAGKLLGLGGAGLLQIAVWLTIVLVTGLGVVPLLMSARIDVPWVALAIAVPFFIVAFLFFGGLILGTGSLGSTMREAQQLAMVWSLMAALPMVMMAVLMREPNGTVARVMTWVPFTAGPVIILRASTDAASLAWWEVAGSFAVLVVATWFALRLGGRLFRVGLLSAGARPSLREIIRQARLAG